MRVALVIVLLASLLGGCGGAVSGTSISTLEPAGTPLTMASSLSSGAPTSEEPPMPTVHVTSTASPAPTQVAPPKFTLTSPEFPDGAAIPSRYSCDGRDTSPPLAWSGVPAGTKALLLTVTDPDARGFVHWVAWDLAPDLEGLAEGASGALPGGATEGRNDFGSIGWRGPCPPSGTHRYVFTLTALSETLGLPRGSQLAAVQHTAEGGTIDETRLEATYRR